MAAIPIKWTKVRNIRRLAHNRAPHRNADTNAIFHRHDQAIAQVMVLAVVAVHLAYQIWNIMAMECVSYRTIQIIQIPQIQIQITAAMLIIWVH